MVAWLQAFVLNYVLGIVLEEVQVVEGKIDWVGLKAKVDAAIVALFAGPILKYVSFEEAAVQAFVDSTIVKAESLVQGQLLATVLTDCAQGKFAAAGAALVAAIEAAV